MSNPHDPRLERLSAYLDGELPTEEIFALEEEIERDAELRALLNSFKRLSNELHVDDSDRKAAEAIRANLRLPGRRRWRWLLPAVPAAAALVVALVLVWPGGTPDPAVTSADLFSEYSEAVLALGEP